MVEINPRIYTFTAKTMSGFSKAFVRDKARLKYILPVTADRGAC